MSAAFETVLVGPSGDGLPVIARFERDEVFVTDPNGAQIVRIPVARIVAVDVDASPQGRRRNATRRVYGGNMVAIHQAGQPPLLLRASSGAGIGAVFRAVGGDAAAQAEVMANLYGYRAFVLDLVTAAKARGAKITVGRKGLAESPLTAVLLIIIGAAALGWQIYEPKAFALYVIGGALIAGGINMLARSPSVRPREVDGSEASLAEYLPRV